MTGTFWIVSYVLLFIGVLAALAVAFAAVRELGVLSERMQSVEVAAAGDFADPSVSTGIRIGSEFPRLDLVNLLTDMPTRIETWPRALLLHVVVSDRSDVAVFSQLRTVLTANVIDKTVVSAVGGSGYLWEIARAIEPATLVHDAQLEVDIAIGTRYRPYAVFLVAGRVVAARPFGSPDDLGDFVTEAQLIADELDRTAKEAS